MLRKPAVRGLVAGPLLVNLVVLAGGAIVAYRFFSRILLEWLPPALGWLRYIVFPFVAVMTASSVFCVFSVLANLLAAPFNSALSRAVLKQLGRPVPLPPPGFVHEISHSVRSEVRKLVYFLKLAVPCVILTLIPGLNLLSLVAWFLFFAWILAVDYLDCALCIEQRPFPAALEALKSRRLLGLGFGIGIVCLTTVPFLNIVAMPIGILGATLLCADNFVANPPDVR